MNIRLAFSISLKFFQITLCVSLVALAISVKSSALAGAIPASNKSSTFLDKASSCERLAVLEIALCVASILAACDTSAAYAADSAADSAAELEWQIEKVLEIL